MREPIGTTFKEEKIFLAMVDSPSGSYDFDIFYKDDKGYIRFFMNGNEHYVGDGSDGKGRLYNIVRALNYFGRFELVEKVNDKGEPVIAICEDAFDDCQIIPISWYMEDCHKK